MVPVFLYSWIFLTPTMDHVGPNGPGNFFDERWQRDLSDSSEKTKAICQGVLGPNKIQIWSALLAALNK